MIICVTFNFIRKNSVINIDNMLSAHAKYLIAVIKYKIWKKQLKNEKKKQNI
jgi:hypothetical protein